MSIHTIGNLCYAVPGKQLQTNLGLPAMVPQYVLAVDTVGGRELGGCQRRTHLQMFRWYSPLCRAHQCGTRDIQ